jgi:hypothetical protein
MEREVISFKEFKEIFEDMAFEPEEISLFVNTLINATDDNVPAFYHYDGVSLVVTPCKVTIDCDIIYKDICVEVTLLQSDYGFGIDERVKEAEKEMFEEWNMWEEDRRQAEEELGLTPPEEDIEDILEEFLKESETLREKRSNK